MIRLLFSAGSEATKQALRQHIEEDLKQGQRAILLVPEQETVSRERDMLTTLSATAQLRFEVSNFTRLANRVFRAVGGLGYRYATPGATSLLMWKTLRAQATALQLYGSEGAPDARLTEHMLSTVSQLKAYCVSPDTLLQAADALSEEDPLRRKLTDVGTVYGIYEEQLRARFDDMTEDVSRAAAQIREHPDLFADTHIYIDSFTDFTGQELNLLAVLMQVAPSLTVTLALQGRSDDSIHTVSSAATYQHLRRMATKHGVQIFYEEPEESPLATPAAFLRRYLFDMQAEKAPLQLAESDFLTVVRCSTPFAEAEYAASVIQRLVREGYRYRDIAIIYRDAGAKVGIIDAALEKEGIPFFLSEKTDISLSPLIKLLLFSLRLVIYGFRTADVIGYLKTGLCGVEPRDISFFECYAELWHLKGARTFAQPFTKNPDGYADTVSARGKRILEAANRVREAFAPPLLALAEQLKEATDTAEMCKALYRHLLALEIPRRLKEQAAARLAAGDRREAEELSRLWGVTADALETVADVLGTDVLTVPELLDALRMVFAATDIGSIPTSTDEVLIGSASTLRADRPRFALVLGLNEGEFPAAVKDKGLLSDADKRRLAELDIHLSADNATTASDELFFLCRALSLPREGLLLSYTENTTDGKQAEPSIGIDRALYLFHRKDPVLPEAADPLERIYSPAAAAEHLRDLDPDARAAVTELLSTRESSAQLAAITAAPPVTDEKASVSPEEAARLFDSSSFNPTGLEKFASCSFAYYCSRILRLREEPGDALNAATVGTFIHYILEHALAAVTAAGKDIHQFTEAEVKALVKETVADYRARLLSTGNELTPRAEALLQRLSTLADLTLTSLLGEFSDSDFTPAFLELDLTAFGSRSTARLQSGEEIPLSGKADRVDLFLAKDKTAYLRVADYKTGRKQFRREDIPGGFCLQMPLYLYALCRGQHPELARRLGLDEDTVFRPAGVTYLSTAVSSDSTPARVDESTALQDAVLRMRREGVLLDDAEVTGAMSRSGNSAIIGSSKSKSLSRLDEAGFEELFDELSDSIQRLSAKMRSGCADADPQKNAGKLPCEYCAFAPVCRAAKKYKKGV